MSTAHGGAGIGKVVPHARPALCCPNSMCTAPVSAHTLECHPRALKKIVLLLPLAFSRIKNIGIMAQPCNYNTWEMEAGGSRVQG